MNGVIIIFGIVAFMGIGMGLIADSDRIEAEQFCEENLHTWSNATEVYKVTITDTHIGCSDGQYVKWYDKQFYLEHKIIMPLYEMTNR